MNLKTNLLSKVFERERGVALDIQKGIQEEIL